VKKRIALENRAKSFQAKEKVFFLEVVFNWWLLLFPWEDKEGENKTQKVYRNFMFLALERFDVVFIDGHGRNFL